MTTRKKLQLNGLWTYRDRYSNEPEGALSECDNINLDKLNVASPRIGFKSVDAKTSTDTYIGNMYNFGGKLILSTNNKIYGTAAINYAADPDPAALTSGSLPPPLNCKYHSFASASSNLYATTASGVYYWSGSGVFAPTGMPKPPLLKITVNGSGTVFNNVQMAYRSVFFRKDDKDQVYIGAPSDRAWVSSSDTSFDNTLVQDLPSDAQAGWFLQIYRTKTVATDGTNDNASDEEFLCYEKVLTSTDITATSVTITDATPDSFLGAALYTNSSQEGIQQAAARPPISEILEPYQGYLFYGAVTLPASQTLTLVSQLSATNTVVLKWKNRSNVVTTLTLTAVASGASTNQFNISASSGALGLQETMDNLAAAINAYAKATGVQVLTANRETEGAVGQIRISVADVSAATIKSFTMESPAAGAKFEPVITSAVEAIESANRNRLMYSKYLEPEAVPTANFFDVGDSTEAIIALVTLRDKLIIIKERSIWKLTGSDPASFGIQLVDSTTTVRDGRTVKSLGGKIYALSTQGIISISETVQIISRRITDKVTDISGEASAWADEEHGLYILNPCLYTAGFTELIVYNTFNDLYTTWSFTEDATDVVQTPHSGVTINSRTIMASKESTSLTKMTLRCQRGFWNSDDSYGDDDLSVNLAYVDSGAAGVIVSSPTGLTVGTKLYETGVGATGIFQILVLEQRQIGPSLKWVAEVAVIVSPQVTNTADLGPGVLAYTFYKPVNSTLTFWPFLGEGIEVYKEFKELAVISAIPVSGQIEVIFSNDISTTSYTYTIASSDLLQGWGQFSWGLQPWGGVEVPSNIVERALVPAEVSKAHQLDIKINFVSNRQKWEVSGISLNYRNIAFTPNNRGDV